MMNFVMQPRWGRIGTTTPAPPGCAARPWASRFGTFGASAFHGSRFDADRAGVDEPGFSLSPFRRGLSYPQHPPDTHRRKRMFAKRVLMPCLLGMGVCFAVGMGPVGAEKKADKKIQKKEVWTDTGDPTLPADYKFQGEYVMDGGACQVIALGKGAFQAVL